jgi:hypothetical protein
MWGAEIDHEELNGILKSCWFSKTDKERNAIWKDYAGDPNADLNDWEKVYGYLTNEYGLEEFSHSFLDNDYSASVYTIYEDSGEYILYIGSSWRSVDHGEAYRFDGFKVRVGWLQDFNKACKVFGLSKTPEWFIVGGTV